MIIAVDFDGTCVTHEYPKVGKEIGAALVLRWLTNNGHKIILWTMRSGRSIEYIPDTNTNPPSYIPWSNELREAVQWFKERDISLYGINENPEQIAWTKSPKVYANIYIDDAAIGCPLTYNPGLSDRPFVDWTTVKMMLDNILSGSKSIGHTDLIGVNQ